MASKRHIQVIGARKELEPCERFILELLQSFCALNYVSLSVPTSFFHHVKLARYAKLCGDPCGDSMSFEIEKNRSCGLSDHLREQKGWKDPSLVDFSTGRRYFGAEPRETNHPCSLCWFLIVIYYFLSPSLLVLLLAFDSISIEFLPK
jgi:hypothetical protein